MVFSSPVFLFCFLPLVLVFYYFQLRFLGNKFRNITLLLFSYGFYLYGAGDFLFFLAGSTFVDYVLALLISRYRDRGRLFVTLSVLINLGLLAYFKYANFFVSELQPLLTHIGLDTLKWTELVLPIGISFFTFQKLSYIVDVYRGKSRPLSNFVDFALYVAMFPQLIAGPIVRFHEISSQLRQRTETWDAFYNGTLRFCWGLSKKVLFSNSCAEVADFAFGLSTGDIGIRVAWLGALTYSLQIYFDFSGYSDMAIGLGQMFGFRLPENFNRPYSSQSITDFWRRWHISLSRWFKDYLYISLGGNRRGVIRTYLNLLTVFFLCGLWHGANWTFIVWGLYHGSFLLIERISGVRTTDRNKYAWFHRTATLFVVIVGWTIFRSDSLTHAYGYISSMFSPTIMPFPYELHYILNYRNVFFIIIAGVVFFLPRDFSVTRYLQADDRYIVKLANAAVITIFLPYCLMLIASGSYNPFIYFQF